MAGFLASKGWAVGPFFVCDPGLSMRKAPDNVIELLRTTIKAMGYELVGAELFRKGVGGLVLRVYIDQEKGIGLEDCSSVSHQISGVLDVEDPISEHYDLEVSSPGLDRPLFELAHFQRFSGEKARLKLSAPVQGRRKLEGVLAGVEEDEVLLEVEDQTYRLDLSEIDSARLLPEF